MFVISLWTGLMQSWHIATRILEEKRPFRKIFRSTIGALREVQGESVVPVTSFVRLTDSLNGWRSKERPEYLNGRIIP
jgi:hypothetical protein